jgi:predicted NUDIX family phosphoesterase
MPIEDIDYLYKNSTKENIVLFVDSSKRDKKLYPSPAEFSIVFNEPFHFVYGIEILDTTIPRTMFMMEYNNNLMYFKCGFRTLNDVGESQIEFVIQDYSTAESFYKRMNSQFFAEEHLFSVDNYENVYDNDLYIERGKSDYPVVRFVNAQPFMLEMSKSTVFNLLGFDQYPKESESYKYSITSNVFNTYVNVNTIPLDNTTPFTFSNPISITTRVPTNINGTEEVIDGLTMFDTSNVITFEYLHDCKYNMGSFVQCLKISSNQKNKTNDNSVITISIKDKSTNRFVFTNLTNTLFNNILDDITIDGLLFESKPNTELILKPNHIYTITITNVFVDKLDVADLEIFVSIGYTYFVDMSNLPETDKMFISKPVYSLDEEDDDVVYIFNDLSGDNSTTICDKNNSVDINIQEHLRIYDARTNTGTFMKIDIEVMLENDVDINENDIFILRMTRIDTDYESYMGEIILSYEKDLTINKAFLRFSNDSLDTSIFNYINMDLPIEKVVDEETNEFTVSSRIVCKLISNAEYPVHIYNGLDGININYNLTYVFIKEFGLISPGMLNLASENYLILRCDEIENHLRGSYDVKEFSPGLGLLNIDVQGYASGRTEFFSIKYKEFHPIGKLTKMKFRFERKSDGLLYDFKNIDLHFIMTIKFLRPSQKNIFDQSTLNPNYDPNYLGYFNKTLIDLRDEESSDDDSDIDPAYFETEYNDRENRLNQQFKNNY